MDFEQIINHCDIIRLKDQKVNKTLSINFFRSIKTKFVEQYLLYNKKYNKIFFSNKQIFGYINKITNLKEKDGFYFKDDILSDIVTFQIKKIEDNRVSVSFINDNSRYKSEILPLSDNEQ